VQRGRAVAAGLHDRSLNDRAIGHDDIRRGEQVFSPATRRPAVTDHISPHWDRTALLVIDLQRDFLDGGAAPVPGTSEVVPTVATLVEAFRAASRPIVHVVRLYEPGGSDVDLLRRAAIEAGAAVVAPGTAGSQIAAGIARDALLDVPRLLRGELQSIGEDEVIAFKPRWSAFHRTALEAWLRDQQVDTVVVAGCNLPNCPRATLFDASERDFRSVLVEDAVSQVTPERVADLAAIGVRVLSSAEVIAGIARGEGPWSSPDGTSHP
jgi:nicotinamidase-related amidase